MESSTALTSNVLIIEFEGFLEVTGSCVHCKNGNISEMTQDRHAVKRDHQEVSHGLSNDVK